ncbi:MAG TPA: hypothetical protein VI168_11730 [Croceibacterium sp.]
MICRLWGHRANRRKAWHDGRDFHSKCIRCGHPMLRNRHGWQASDEADADGGHDAG